MNDFNVTLVTFNIFFLMFYYKIMFQTLHNNIIILIDTIILLTHSLCIMFYY